MGVAQNHYLNDDRNCAAPSAESRGGANVLFGSTGDPECCLSKPFTIPEGKWATLEVCNSHALECFVVEKACKALPCCVEPTIWKPYKINGKMLVLKECETNPMIITMPGCYRLRYVGNALRGPSRVDYDLIRANSVPWQMHAGLCATC